MPWEEASFTHNIISSQILRFPDCHMKGVQLLSLLLLCKLVLLCCFQHTIGFQRLALHSWRGLTSQSPRNHAKMLNPLADDSMALDEGYRQRFASLGELYGGSTALSRLQAARVCVIGLGGVGSWAVEALARSGIGHFTLIDMDDVCVSNINRQLVAQSSTVGRLKADVLRERILDINPSAAVRTICDFVRPENIHTLLDEVAVDYVIDAADGVTDKAAIIAYCALRGVPVLTSGGIGGLTDPTLIAVSDLTQANGDKLLMRVRRKLRADYGYPAGDLRRKVKRWHITAVHTLPTGSRRDRSSGRACADNGTSLRQCDGLLGSACFVSGSFGFILAGQVISALTNGNALPPRVPGITAKVPPAVATDDCSCASSGAVAAEGGGGRSVSDSLAALDRFLISYQHTAHMVDAHCHLQLGAFHGNHDLLLEHMQRNHIIACSVCATSPADWEQVAALHALRPDAIIPSFGLHPWWIEKHLKASAALSIADYDQLIAGQGDGSWMAKLSAYLEMYPQAGVGECGLDKKVRDAVSMDLQLHILSQHLDIAARHQRPISIHCVAGCWGNLLKCLQEHCDANKGSRLTSSAVILHCCNSLPVDMLGAFNKLPHVYYSISASILNNQKHLKLVSKLPRDRLLLESDCPDQLPLAVKEADCAILHNAPGIIGYSCHKLSELLQCSIEELAETVTRNACRALNRFR